VVAVFIMLTTAPYFLFFCRCGIFHSMFWRTNSKHCSNNLY
jgi:hypothetical protein